MAKVVTMTTSITLLDLGAFFERQLVSIWTAAAPWLHADGNAVGAGSTGRHLRDLSAGAPGTDGKPSAARLR